jgi:hypothetical protein
MHFNGHNLGRVIHGRKDNRQCAVRHGYKRLGLTSSVWSSTHCVGVNVVNDGSFHGRIKDARIGILVTGEKQNKKAIEGLGLGCASRHGPPHLLNLGKMQRDIVNTNWNAGKRIRKGS